MNRLQDAALVAISEELDEIRQRFRAAAKDAHHDLMTSHAQAPPQTRAHAVDLPGARKAPAAATGSA